MKNIGIFMLEKNANENTVMGAFAKFKLPVDRFTGNSGDFGKSKKLFINRTMDDGCCSLLGCAPLYDLDETDKTDVANKISEYVTRNLEEIAHAMNDKKYDKKLFRFNKKRIQYQKELNQARDSSYGTGNHLAAIAGNYEKESGSAAAVKEKLDSYMKKNQALNASQSYIGSRSIGMAQQFMDSGSGFKNSDIQGAIKSTREEEKDNIHESFEEFKTLLKELLKSSATVGFMLTNDDKGTFAEVIESKYKIDDLKLENLVFAKTNTMYLISK